MDYFDGPDGLEEREVLILDELADTKACASISCVLWLRRWKVSFGIASTCEQLHKRTHYTPRK
jgi:hypothetical protein